MASLSSLPSSSVLLRPSHRRSLPHEQGLFSFGCPLPTYPTAHHQSRTHQNHESSGFLRRAAPSTVPPPPPPEDPISGLQEVLSKIQDRVRIFVAVLFWMSLFFWGSAWEGRDDSGKKKGPWLKK